MVTKKFIIEVKEGITPDCGDCMVGENSGICDKYCACKNGLLDCMKYNLNTMEIKEYEED